MTIHFEEYIFEGPYSSIGELEDTPGVYVIICNKNECYFPIDVGQTDTVKSMIEKHDQKNLWEWYCSGTLKFSAMYTPGIQEAHRMKIVKKLKTSYNLTTVEQTRF